MLGRVSMLPHIEEEPRKEFFDTLSRGIDDIINSSEDSDAIKRLEKELHG